MSQPTPPDSDEKIKDKKQLEIMCHVMADTVVRQLVKAGCESGELIDFASEIVRCVTDRGFAQDPESRSATPLAESADVQEVRWNVEQADGSRYRIRGDRVELAPLTVDDLETLEAWREDPEIRKTFSGPLLAYLIGHIDTLAEDATRHDFIVRDENGRRIGLVSLFHISRTVRKAETAKLLGEPSARGKGYAAEATRLLLGFAFDVLKLRKVYLRTAGFNLHNIRLNERAGFKFEGILRESEVLMDRRIDVVQMSMLDREQRQMYRMVDIQD